ncbi:MAG: co-chaperone DjlA [Zoogloeaceae bacterium]|jgi:DnaJ like chaperone protein|nr:co-chaperone DjlA [Zoogloeaceae bacterium]
MTYFFLAFIGALIAGFPGAIIGLVLAFGFKKLASLGVETMKGRLEEAQESFLDTSFAVMGALAKADGRVSQKEIEAAEQMFSQFMLNPEQKHAAREAFSRGKSPDFDLEGAIAGFMAAARGNRALIFTFLHIQIAVVMADGAVHSAEEQMLLRIARQLGISPLELAQLKAMLRTDSGGARSFGGFGGGYQREQHQYSQPRPEDRLADAYAALGISPSASEAEIKRAYRKLMSENHPDKLVGKGLPESMRQMAEEKTREISTAYALIKETRGFV